MISSTFSIFPGIGPRLERYLWRMGVLEWGDFLERKNIPGFSPARKSALDSYVRAAAEALGSGNIRYFQHMLGPGGAWRLWERLGEDSVCLDIETDGGRPGEGVVTVVGIYSHGEYRPYVWGNNLTEDALQGELDAASLLVTYSGGAFDIPFLRTHFPRLHIEVPHLDLCPAGHRAGLKGGLKKVEKLVGIRRADEVEGLSGYEAVLLWQAHLRGAEGALDTLVSYNREDTVNLHALASKIYSILHEASGFPLIAAGRPCP